MGQDDIDHETDEFPDEMTGEAGFAGHDDHMDDSVRWAAPDVYGAGVIGSAYAGGSRPARRMARIVLVVLLVGVIILPLVLGLFSWFFA